MRNKIKAQMPSVLLMLHHASYCVLTHANALCWIGQITILYGTETYNSYEYAILLLQSLKKYHFDAQVYSLDSFDLKKLISIKILIIISSTTGNGDIPANSKKFWKFLLKRNLPSNFLDHIFFTTFGLGDSSYPKFNYCIRKFHIRLLQLGAKEISIRGEGDEQKPEGIEGFYKEWENQLIKNLNTKYPLPTNLKPLDDDYFSNTIFPPIFKFKILSKGLKRDTQNQDLNQISITRSTFFNHIKLGKVISNQRITSLNHFQDVRNLKIQNLSDNQDSAVRPINPGDSISLYPYNDLKDVNSLIEDQNWSDIADYKISFESDDYQNYLLNYLNIDTLNFVKPLTLRSLLIYHFDLNSIPRRSFFENVFKFSTNERQREKLYEFSKFEHLQDLYDYSNRPRRSLLEVILEFDSLKIPVEYIFDVFPILRPRLYSVASIDNINKNFQLCIAIIKYQTIIKKLRKGVCTNYIKNLKENDNLIFKINKQPLHSKVSINSLDKPMILIGPGTGIAPIRSLIEFKVNLYDKLVAKNIANEALDENQIDNLNLSEKLFLFTGNRFESKDFLYGDLFKYLSEENRLTLFPTFSRDNQIINKKRIRYVQDRIYNEKNLIFDLVFNKNAIIYLCGSSGRMPIQIRITLKTILIECGDLSDSQADSYLKKIENSNRYIQETW
ncbi:NAPDH-dependent diflavin reductase [Ascoidea rubescens DSM 1968]|uniref:NADPH-dependent diflavin oxidoreductase 1 n=1 Tax=Ascoidea rubescens DSM 1968 TaxID=1344418 RepID=A0A1D2VJW4_9ASCO|nr:riboflavin synthase domain-like protein [Ascoidea rubescens DSM 1968]ODV61911.1 riboflavin synthase domain-like protein [Ascoidea rubescens DSM 1968]